MQLLVNIDGLAGEKIVQVDTSAIEQILFNLVVDSNEGARLRLDLPLVAPRTAA